MSGAFAYVHARPDGTVFYVGKGTRSRAFEMSAGRRSKHHQRIVAKHGKEDILVGLMECSSADIAFELEKGLIKCFRRMGVVLCNHTDGGEGWHNPTEADKVKHAQAMRTVHQNPETKRKHSEALCRANVKKEVIERRREAQRKVYESGGNRPNLGKVWITKDRLNKMVAYSSLQRYLEQGWKRGRICE